MNKTAPHESAAAREKQFRDALADHVRQGERDLAIQYARMLLAAAPGGGTDRFIRKLAQGGEAARLDLRPYRVALLSSFSIEFLHDALIAQGVANGLGITVYQGGFGTFRQEILDPASGLYAFRPDLAVLAVEGEDWLAEAYGRYSSADPNLQAHPARFKDELASLLGQFRAHSQAPLLVHDFAPPAYEPLGIADGASPQGQAGLLKGLNQAMAEVGAGLADTHVLRYAALVSRVGGEQWYDPRMKLYAGFPLTQAAARHLSREYLKYARALLGLSRKCLVLDLDNTLWGGVVGEDGIDGIKIGPQYPGNAFMAFQHSIQALRARGVILGLASKNNPQDVDEVFANHPHMVLRRGDFAAAEIHWEPKSESLRRIAETLNIGLEHIVFADDNPAECEHIRLLLPMVTVIQLPPRPENYVQALYEEGWFDTLSLSAEDAQRAALYAQRAQAETLRGSSADLEGFYRDLDMVLTFAPVHEKNLPRVAQLTVKTNQFNATTRRYTEAEVARRMADPAWVLAAVSVADRFGDNGLVGVMMARREGEALAIDTFLLSCRVIGRAVETAMLARLCAAAASMGATSLLGVIVPTPKNEPARDLFKRHGFTHEATDEAGADTWRLDLETSPIPYPAWFKLAD